MPTNNREQTETCFSCGDEISPDNSFTCDLTSQNFCQTCFDDRFHYCSDCDSFYDDNNSCNCDDIENNCDEESFNTRNFTIFNNDDYETFGVEIEVEQGDKNGLDKELNAFCGIGYDGSLDETGLEITTPPLNLDGTIKIIKDTCDKLKKRGFKATDNCGLHIHFAFEKEIPLNLRAEKNLTKSQIETEYIKMFQKIVYFFEPFIYSVLPPRRLTNHFCKPLKNKRTIKKTLDKDEFKKVKNKRQLFTDDRYFGFNLNSLTKYGTIEFRYHSGTIEPNKIINWLKLIKALADLSKRLVNLKNCKHKSITDRKVYNLMINRVYSLRSFTGQGLFSEVFRILRDYTYNSPDGIYFLRRFNKFAKERSHQNINLFNYV